MSKNEKQAIEEMAKDLADAWIVDFEGNPHDLSEVLMFSDIFNIAEQLCEQNYRKQIKAEWKSGTKNGQYGYYCTNCDAGFTGENAEWIAKEHDFCPKCGARMKGGAE